MALPPDETSFIVAMTLHHIHAQRARSVPGVCPLAHSLARFSSAQGSGDTHRGDMARGIAAAGLQEHLPVLAAKGAQHSLIAQYLCY